MAGGRGGGGGGERGGGGGGGGPGYKRCANGAHQEQSGVGSMVHTEEMGCRKGQSGLSPTLNRLRSCAGTQGVATAVGE